MSKMEKDPSEEWFHYGLSWRASLPLRSVEWLATLLKAIIPVAASGWVGRCDCGRAIPWERQGWASPICYAHQGLEEDDHDRKRRAKLEGMVRSVAEDNSRGTP